MNTKRIIRLSLLCIAALITTSVSAESLMDIYQRALQNDPIIRQAEALYLANLESKPQARSAVLPFVSLSAGAGTSHSQDPNRPTNFATGVVDPDISTTEVDRDTSNWSINLSLVVCPG